MHKVKSKPATRGKKQKIRLAIAGVGNCASALVQGLDYYRGGHTTEGLLHEQIGPYKIDDIEIVAAFDIDKRKVGRPLHEAISALPNCAKTFIKPVRRWPLKVKMGPVLDGVSKLSQTFPESERIVVAAEKSVDIAEELRKTRASVLVCFLPVGSKNAVEAYAEACLEAQVSFVNCIPVFIASDKKWAARFKKRGLPVVGDDIKSQVGATAVHRALMRLLSEKGAAPVSTYQLNVGGNTDFLNMLERPRLEQKKISKTEAVQSQISNTLPSKSIHIGPSDYVPFLKDQKQCFLKIDWVGFGGIQNGLELRLTVEDSPNSAGVAIDAIRCAQLAMDKGIGGALDAVSSFSMKHPTHQVSDSEAWQNISRWIDQAERV